MTEIQRMAFKAGLTFTATGVTMGENSYPLDEPTVLQQGKAYVAIIYPDETARILPLVHDRTVELPMTATIKN